MGAPIIAARAGAARAGAGAAARGKAGTAAASKTAAAAPPPVVELPPAKTTTTNKSGGRSSGQAPRVFTDQRGAPKVFRTDGLKVANAGGGFVLGTVVYVVGLTYLRGGKPAVQRWFRAKFFNQVGPA